MFIKYLKALFKRDKPKIVPSDRREKILFLLNEIDSKEFPADRFKTIDAMRKRINTASRNPKELMAWIRKAQPVVKQKTYVPDDWKQGVRVVENTDLDSYLTDRAVPIDPQTWFNKVKEDLLEFSTDFKKLEQEDYEYYGRNYSAILDDIAEVLMAYRDICLKP